MTPLTLLCPGQGAQAVGMAKAWHDHSAIVRDTFAAADQQLATLLPKPLSELCFDGPPDLLNRTDISQPALFTAGVACARALCEQWGTSLDELPLAAAAGLSLGEYTALHLAGSIDFESALRLVALRGQAMQDAAEATDSTMLALIGADEPAAIELSDAARGSGVLVCANFNAPGQIVLSGSTEAVARAESLAAERGLRATRLAVAGAFHSPLMQPAADRLAEALRTTAIVPPRCPVLSNVTARPHTPDPERIADALVAQLTSPVRWAECCLWLKDNTPQDTELHELAPGKTLAGLMRRIEKSLKVTTHDAP